MIHNEGVIFEEMSDIDENPHCPSVTAVTALTLKTIRRDEFQATLQSDQDSAVVQFNRFRETSQELLALKAAQGQNTYDPYQAK
jgi:CRP-like cAMP-binding protein